MLDLLCFTVQLLMYLVVVNAFLSQACIFFDKVMLKVSQLLSSRLLLQLHEQGLGIIACG